MLDVSRSRVLASFCCALCFSLFAVAAEQTLTQDLAKDFWNEEQIAPGIQLRQKHFEELFGSPQFISVLAVELNHPTARVGFAAAQQFGEKEMMLPELAEKSGAIATINGGFFGKEPTANSGILKIDGKVFPFTKKEPADLYFVGGSAVGIDAHEQWHFLVHSNAGWPDDWIEVRDALAGGHPLIIDGKIRPEITRKNYDVERESRHVLSQHPRTAIGVTTNRLALLVTVDGRHPGKAAGLTMLQLAMLMKSLGCENGINLDGGGSTTAWVRGKGIVNHPSDNKMFDAEGARRIRTAVIVEITELAPE